jgi:transcriptional regulator with XRE-family HTH domain
LRLAGGLNQPEVVARVRSGGQLRLTQSYLSQLENGLRITKPGTIAIIRGTIELILSERLQEVRRLLAASR